MLPASRVTLRPAETDASKLRVVVIGAGFGGLQVACGLRVPGYDNAYVIGDMTAATDDDGDLLPQLAPVAVQQGEHVAEQIRRTLRREPVEPFVYDDPGMMATIGRNAAVVQSPSGWKLTGWSA